MDVIIVNYYYDNILNSANYIEENLTNDINISDIVECAGFSKFHFLRIFRAISGYTINDYIKRRRMTEAAKLLISTDMRIIDIAILYMYSSQEAFTRAFKDVYNVTPNYYRTNKISYCNLNQLTLSEEILKSKGDNEFIEPIIVEKDSFTLVGLEYEGKNSKHEVPKLWNRLYENMGDIEKNVSNQACYGLELYDEMSEENGCFKYIAGFEINSYSTDIKADKKIVKIEKSRYAVFPIKAIIDNIPKTISKIYSVCLPQTGLKIKCNYDFEYYDDNFIPNSNESFLYFYIPIE